MTTQPDNGEWDTAAVSDRLTASKAAGDSKAREIEKPLLLSRYEAARLLGVSERHLVNLEKRGVFKATRLGAAVRYRRSDIEATLEKLSAMNSEAHDGTLVHAKECVAGAGLAV